MIATNVAEFRKNVCQMLDVAINSDKPVCISTENGNAILLSERGYKGLIETLYISSDTKFKNEILARAHGTDEDFIGENEIGL